MPEELPVSGDPYNETALELIFPGRQPRFKLNGKKLQLLDALDRDEENLSHVVFQVRVISLRTEIRDGALSRHTEHDHVELNLPNPLSALCVCLRNLWWPAPCRGVYLERVASIFLSDSFQPCYSTCS